MPEAELRVVATIEDRYDDRLAGLGDGRWASATDTALTVWDDRTEVGRVVNTARRPGPLAWLERSRELAWGPTTLTPPPSGRATAGDPTAGDPTAGTPTARDTERPTDHDVDDLVNAALADAGLGEGEDAARHFVLVAGAVDGEGAAALLVVQRRESRAVASRAPKPRGPQTRTAIVDRHLAAAAEVVDDGGPTPNAVTWAGGPLALGFAAGVQVLRPDRRQLGTRAAVLALASHPIGGLAAGLADGTVACWSPEWDPAELPATHLHQVRAVTWSPDGTALATGDAGGKLQLWSDGHPASALDVGAAIDAVTWLASGRLVVKAGGPGGHLLVVEA